MRFSHLKCENHTGWLRSREPARSASDPVELIADLIAAVEKEMVPGPIHAVFTSVAGGRATSLRLAAALVERPEVLAEGRSPAPRAVVNLLIGYFTLIEKCSGTAD